MILHGRSKLQNDSDVGYQWVMILPAVTDPKFCLKPKAPKHGSEIRWNFIGAMVFHRGCLWVGISLPNSHCVRSKMDSQEELNFGFHTVFVGRAEFLYDQSHHHPSRRCCCWKLASPRKPSFVGHRGMKICRFRTATKIESFVKGITYLSTQNVTLVTL